MRAQLIIADACKQKFVAHLHGIQFINVTVDQIRIDDILQIAVGVLQILCRLVQIVYQQRIMIIIRFFRLKKTQQSSSRSMGSAKVCGCVGPSILFKV